MRNSYDYYKEKLKGVPLPLAFVDLDLLFDNCRRILELAQGMPIRIATKSVRSLSLLHLVMKQFPQFKGLMAFSAKEAAYLSAHGFDDILIAYPTVEEAAIEAALEFVKEGRRIVFTVDCKEHCRILDQLGKKYNLKIEVSLDVDMSIALPGIFFGVRRSPIRSKIEAERFVEDIAGFSNINLCAVMGYEAQLAGAPDRNPFRMLDSIVIRILKKITAKYSFRRRSEIVTFLKSRGFNIQIVNGGGTGSLKLSRKDQSLTELTAGSALFCPTLFDYYDDLGLLPAAGFALPVTRLPTEGIVTCHSGGFVASGSHGADRLPTPYLPPGMKLLPQEGAGEVQTPMTTASSHLKIGDPVFFRHAKAGELCEHFLKLHLLHKNGFDTVNTYRGDGQQFP